MALDKELRKNSSRLCTGFTFVSRLVSISTSLDVGDARDHAHVRSSRPRSPRVSQGAPAARVKRFTFPGALPYAVAEPNACIVVAARTPSRCRCILTSHYYSILE